MISLFEIRRQVLDTAAIFNGGVTEVNDFLKDVQKGQQADIEFAQNIEDFDNIQLDAGGMLAIEREMVRQFPSLYVLKYKPIRRKPMTFISTKSPFKHRPWQQGILDDKHPDKVVMKARQLGMSELSVSEVIWFLDTHDDTKIMYTFPRDRQMVDFSTTRIAPAFQESEYLRSLLAKEANNVALKKIGNSWLFMRSAWGSELGEGVDADCAFFDEYDRMADNVELAFQESLKSSIYGWLRRWSTPTIPGRAIDAVYNKSDKKRYVWKCEHCGEQQFLTFDDNIIQIGEVNVLSGEVPDGSYIIGCKKCKKELNRWSVGEWIPYNSGRSISGYAISQLDATWISADDIMRRSITYPSRQLFHNYVIGTPYATTGMLITDADVLESVRLPRPIVSRTNEYSSIIAGIDWGNINWMIVCGMRGSQVDVLDIYWVEDDPAVPLKSANMFAAILRAFQPDIIVADHGYGADRNSYMFTQFPYAMYSCQFTTVKDAQARVRWIDQWSEQSRMVTVDKTVKMSRTLHTVKGRLLSVFPMNEKLLLLIRHLKNVRIMDEEDGKGNLYQIATRVGDDHLACCLTYCLIGVDKVTGMRPWQQQFNFEFI